MVKGARLVRLQQGSICVTGDVCNEVIEDLDLDKMWETARMG